MQVPGSRPVEKWSPPGNTREQGGAGAWRDNPLFRRKFCIIYSTGGRSTSTKNRTRSRYRLPPIVSSSL
ncbi:hypothetical protein HanRHA438_Chr16g0762281 [Helianthus annuus]|nr:hypothetical protein HanRHA438_Chr16g0762281 [Helianthus annuus]